MANKKSIVQHILEHKYYILFYILDINQSLINVSVVLHLQALKLGILLPAVSKAGPHILHCRSCFVV